MPRQRTPLAENAFPRLVIAWETFLSDWFLCCLSHDAMRFAHEANRKLAVSFQQQIASSPHLRYSGQLRRPVVALGRHPGLATVRDLIDPRGRNMEFPSFEDLRDRCNVELPQTR